MGFGLVGFFSSASRTQITSATCAASKCERVAGPQRRTAENVMLRGLKTQLMELGII
jgi:hypothetical protein